MTHRVAVLAFALVWPLVMAWLYFVVLAGDDQRSGLVRLAYGGGKAVQFLLPVASLRYFTGSWPRLTRPRWRGTAIGVGFGLLTAGLILAGYFGPLHDRALFRAAPDMVRARLSQFGVTTPGPFWVMAVFIAGIHSLLEEYYWRWFVFGQLRRLLPLAPAIAVSSLGFMAHHVVVLAVYLPGQWLTGIIPFSLGVAVGGAAWAWLYDRTGSIYAAWISHLLVDVALMVIGYDLVFVRPA